MCNSSSRQARREEKFLRREEKNLRRIEKYKRKAEKIACRQEYRNYKKNLYSDTHQLESIKTDEMVATLRTMFPECDPQYIRDCIAQETSDHVQRVADKLLTSPYPKISFVPVTPSAPLLNDEYENSLPPYEPPSYNEVLLSSHTQVPPQEKYPLSGASNDHRTSSDNVSRNDSLPNNFSSNFYQDDNVLQNNNNSFTSSSSSHEQRITHPDINRIFETQSATLTRPPPKNFIRSLSSDSNQIFIIPKVGTTIENGFPVASYPTHGFESRDISRNDWEVFINGLNALLSASNSPEASTPSASSTSTSTTTTSSSSSSPSPSHSILGHLRWIVGGGSGGSSNNIGSNNYNSDKQMEEYTNLTKNYLKRWNEKFFKPRKVEIELMSKNKKAIFKNKPDYVQYLSVKLF